MESTTKQNESVSVIDKPFSYWPDKKIELKKS